MVNLDFALDVYYDTTLFLHFCCTILSTILCVLSVEIPVLIYPAAEISCNVDWQRISSQGMRSEPCKTGAINKRIS
jgi:hypothetical protein